ncbi:MAG: 2-amino-4-hydroxy-6-hydroxymethyldihydropteridine diphosphokinase [Lachnospiraceae bacterium]|nr:2-amino-4-hydroxy-6-hydroxymethyldihydropteridine diphosphokinase [Lachnospiraceae bacterium]
MDIIKIENLEIYAYHGVYPEENKLGQSFYINAALYTDTRQAGLSDELTQSTNYGEVCHFMTDWMKQHTCKLIEAAAEQLARASLLAFPLVKKLTLEIRKPQAPVGLPFESVSVQIERGWHRVYLAIGSNLGEREAYIQRGIDGLQNCPDIRVKNVSSMIVTKPYGGVEQGDFVNGCLCVETLLTPGELLKKLHEIEQAAGRVREVHWGPRTLDLDIIFYDDLVYEDEELIIPHVDMENRSFVLEPMVEIAPNLRHPILKKTMVQLHQILLGKMGAKTGE